MHDKSFLACMLHMTNLFVHVLRCVTLTASQIPLTYSTLFSCDTTHTTAGMIKKDEEEDPGRGEGRQENHGDAATTTVEMNHKVDSSTAAAAGELEHHVDQEHNNKPEDDNHAATRKAGAGEDKEQDQLQENKTAKSAPKEVELLQQAPKMNIRERGEEDKFDLVKKALEVTKKTKEKNKDEGATNSKDSTEKDEEEAKKAEFFKLGEELAAELLKPQL